MRIKNRSGTFADTVSGTAAGVDWIFVGAPTMTGVDGLSDGVLVLQSLSCDSDELKLGDAGAARVFGSRSRRGRHTRALPFNLVEWKRAWADLHASSDL